MTKKKQKDLKLSYSIIRLWLILVIYQIFLKKIRIEEAYDQVFSVLS